MDAAIIGLLALGGAIFAIGMRAARNSAKAAREARDTMSEKRGVASVPSPIETQKRDVASAPSPIELAAVGPGQSTSSSEKRDMLAGAGR